jgi:chondroitin AC lyase
VALGAQINASAAVSNVLTTLNQSYLKTTVTYSIGAGPQTITSGTVNPSGLQWVHHDETGYFFPGGTTSATIRAQEQTGRLYDINGYGTSTTYMVVQTQDVFSVDINHGKAFTGRSYAYVVVPGLAVGAMDNYPLSDLQILSNTSTIQAMKSVYKRPDDGQLLCGGKRGRHHGEPFLLDHGA